MGNNPLAIIFVMVNTVRFFKVITTIEKTELTKTHLFCPSQDPKLIINVHSYSYFNKAIDK